MSLLKVYSVYDSKIEAYMQPFYCQSKGQAVRSFAEIANDKSHNIGKYPEDFTLFEFGDFNEADGKFHLYDTPYSIGKALEFVKS